MIVTYTDGSEHEITTVEQPEAPHVGSTLELEFLSSDAQTFRLYDVLSVKHQVICPWDRKPRYSGVFVEVREKEG